MKTDAYKDINAYLSQLSESTVKSVGNILAFNIQNAGTEGAEPGDVPAFPSGQVKTPLRTHRTSDSLIKQDDLHEAVKSQGMEDRTYSKALQYIRYQCRDRGIDAALHLNNDGSTTIEFDALLLCDHKQAGQQLAAQAGMVILASFHCKHIVVLTPFVGYPIITIPIGTDTDGLPVSLSFQHTAWQERTLIKWASAIEDLILEVQGWRPTPQYRNFHSKNIPIDLIP